jgi:hypothetical protein
MILHNFWHSYHICIIFLCTILIFFSVLLCFNFQVPIWWVLDDDLDSKIKGKFYADQFLAKKVSLHIGVETWSESCLPFCFDRIAMKMSKKVSPIQKLCQRKQPIKLRSWHFRNWWMEILFENHKIHRAAWTRKCEGCKSMPSNWGKGVKIFRFQWAWLGGYQKPWSGPWGKRNEDFFWLVK